MSTFAFRYFLPPCEGRRDADLVALGDHGLHSVEKSDVLSVHMDKDKAADFACFVVDTLFDAGKRLIEVSDDVAHGGSGCADFRKLVGEFAEWCWY